MARGMRRFTVYQSDPYGDNDLDNLPKNPVAFMEWLRARINEIPPECLSSALIEFDTDGDYDSPSPELEISYSRFETDAEMAEREAQEAADLAERQQYAEKRERQTLADLKRKYEGK